MSFGAQANLKLWARKSSPRAMASLLSGAALATLPGVVEVDAVVGEHRVDAVGHGGDDVTQEVTGYAQGYLLVQFDKSEL